jgi:threonine/homoserine/homoserine lactone efflux protein
MQTLFEAFTLGFLGGLVPGAVLTMILVSVLQKGFVGGVRTFLYCVLAEIVIVAVLLSVILSLPLPNTTFHYVGFIGGLVLVYFAWNIQKIKQVEANTANVALFTIQKIFILSATNALLYIFWLTVCVPLMLSLAETTSLFTAVSSFMLAFEIGWALSTFALLLVFLKMRNVLTKERYVHLTFRVVAFIMFLLALRLWWQSLSSLQII